MSKIAIFFCAAAVITSAIAASLKISDANPVNLDIDRAIENINTCATEIHHQMSALGPQPTVIHFDIIDEFERNITDRVQKTRSVVQEIYNERKRFDIKMVCKDFLEDLEHTALDVMSSLTGNIYFELFDVVGPLADVFRESSGAQEKLKGLKDRARACHGDECDELEKIMNETSTIFFTKAAKAFDDYVALVNGTKLIHTLYTSSEWINFLAEQSEVVNRTTSCLDKKIRSEFSNSESADIAVAS